MEKLDIFRRLIDAEDSAQRIYSDALTYQARLAEDLSEMKKQLRTQMYAKADAYIAQAERMAAKAADKDIENLNENLQQNLDKIKYRYEDGHGAWSDEMFSYAIIGGEASRE